MNDSFSGNPRSRVEQLAAKMLDGILSAAEQAELLHAIDQDAQACDQFVRHVAMHAVLRDEIAAAHPQALSGNLFGVSQGELSELTAGLSSATPISDGAPTQPLSGHPPILTSLLDMFSRRTGVISRAAAVLLLATALAAGALLLTFWPKSRETSNPSDIAARGSLHNDSNKASSPSVENVQQTERSGLEEFVARIVRVSPDLVWNQPTAPLDFLLRVKQGGKLSVAKGLVQMEFSSGAKIILHGPATFTPTSSTTGHLESGRLTGEVTEGNFHLTTPAAEVIDLGTEFGVQVDIEKSTDVVVFDGKVQVVDTAGSRESLDMTKGMAARIHSDGTKHFGVETEIGQFARFVPAMNQDKNELSVVDVLCGGDGFNTSLSGAADPLTGKQDHGEQKPGNRRSNGKYHPVDWNPILDGVFMPTGIGERTPIDSLGSTIDLPKNNGLTWGPMWARRWESTLQTAGVTTDFWGRRTLKNILLRLKQSKVGMIGMHANVGFTIDLRAVRLLQRRDVDEFRAIVTNLDNSEEEYLEDARRLKRTADFRLLVDGELRYQRLGFRRADGDAEILVDLKPEDRFLTVIASDGEGDSSYDHVVLIDPVIALQPVAENTRVSTQETTAVTQRRGNFNPAT
jgi:hypothetical protein